jgi:hypothetical protein
LEEAMNASALRCHADEGDDHHGDSSEQKDDGGAEEAVRADVAQRPAKAVILGIAEELLDLHALGVQGHDVSRFSFGN